MNISVSKTEIWMDPGKKKKQREVGRCSEETLGTE